jgi:flavin reductase (DIM6/NTAB) family NADH-FMN oxidoreductase RutF
MATQEGGAAEAMGRIPSGIFIVTAMHAAAETGLLASWVQQCSFEPLMVTVAVRQGRDVTTWLVTGAPFTINILAEGQSGLVAHFGKGFQLGQPAFAGLNLLRQPGTAPVLADALAYLDCRVEGHHASGDHELFLGRVVGGRLIGTARPMVHVRKNGLRY